MNQLTSKHESVLVYVFEKRSTGKSKCEQEGARVRKREIEKASFSFECHSLHFHELAFFSIDYRRIENFSVRVHTVENRFAVYCTQTQTHTVRTKKEMVNIHRKLLPIVKDERGSVVSVAIHSGEKTKVPWHSKFWVRSKWLCRKQQIKATNWVEC